MLASLPSRTHFFGGGTTGVAAGLHGRRWIGMELNPGNEIEVATQRMALEVEYYRLQAEKVRGK